MSATCERCKGTGWLRYNVPGPGWPDDSILSARLHTHHWKHSRMPYAEASYCPVCPCTIKGGSPNTGDGTIGQPDIYFELAAYLDGRTIEEICAEGDHSPDQLRIRLTWVSHRLNLKIAGTKNYGACDQPHWHVTSEDLWWIFPEEEGQR